MDRKDCYSLQVNTEYIIGWGNAVGLPRKLTYANAKAL